MTGGGALPPKIDGEFQFGGAAPFMGGVPFIGGAPQPLTSPGFSVGGALAAKDPGRAMAVLAVPGGGIVDWPYIGALLV